MKQIDFILPWVDPNDPAWQKERMKYDKNLNKEDKDSITRFRDMNTLKYVLRSIEKYCPWYHKIYLITIGHTPKWLNINHPKIELITHEKLFINKTTLPVFNSNAIEMNLVNIPNLSEKFVYLNDDMIVWKPLKIERFFIDDKPVDFFSHSAIPRNMFYELIKGKDTWIDAINNNIKLINENMSQSLMDKSHLYHHSYSLKQRINNFIYMYIYNKVIWINHWHHPQPYVKSTIHKVYKTYQKDMLKTAKHKFRSSNDVTPYLYRYWHLLTDSFEPYYHNDGLVAQISSLKYLKNIINNLADQKSINFVCFNDQMTYGNQSEFEDISQLLNDYLNEIFPDKASFEF